MVLDAWLGEPPTAWHPVVWIGKAFDCLEGRAPRGRWPRFGYGLAVALLLPLTCGRLGGLAERVLPWPLVGALLWPAFAGKALLQAAERVERALRNGDLEQARGDLRWLVSRPTADLDESLVSAAAVESLAENFVDSWLAPLLSYGAFGLGGAYVYRAVNTGDAMWGYRTPGYEWLGKSIARLDDVLNWIPARLAAAGIVALSPHPARASRVWRADGARTASPNAGQSMAAMAGALDVCLEKRDQYVLHSGAPAPTAEHIRRARRLISQAMAASALVSLALSARRGTRAVRSSRSVGGRR